MCDVKGCREEATVETGCLDSDCPDSDVIVACFAHQWMVCKPRPAGGW